jgi:hypothetical protein
MKCNPNPKPNPLTVGPLPRALVEKRVARVLEVDLEVVKNNKNMKVLLNVCGVLAHYTLAYLKKSVVRSVESECVARSVCCGLCATPYLYHKQLLPLVCVTL